MDRKKTLLERAKEQADLKLFKFEKAGDHVQGQIVKMNTGGKFDSTFFTLQDEDGKIEVLAASQNTVMGRKILDSQPELEDDMCVLYLGEKKSSTGKVYKDFSVVVDRKKEKKPGPDTEGSANGGSDASAF